MGLSKREFAVLLALHDGKVASQRDVAAHADVSLGTVNTIMKKLHDEGLAEGFVLTEAGAQALKIFPSSAFGPQYIKALKAVLPSDIAVFAVGGVTPENLAQWIDAGCAGAGLGSDLYRAGQSVERTAQQAAAFVKAYREAVQ